MKVLILEDNPNRIDVFKHYFENFETYITDNVEEAKELWLNHQPFNLMFLDHDLDNRTFVDSTEENTGYQFAKFLTDKDYSNTDIIIHSMNPAGALHMLNCFQNKHRVFKITFPALMEALKTGSFSYY